MPKQRILKVHAIKNGTVIDHIPAGRGLTLVKLLKLFSHKGVVTIGLNFESKKLTQKDIIKIEKRELTPDEVNQVAIFAPTATLNIIRQFGVVKKTRLQIPKVIKRVLRCPNPNCITNAEHVMTKFYSQIEKKKLLLSCHYCEKTFSEEEIHQFNTH